MLNVIHDSVGPAAAISILTYDVIHGLSQTTIDLVREKNAKLRSSRKTELNTITHENGLKHSHMHSNHTRVQLNR